MCIFRLQGTTYKIGGYVRKELSAMPINLGSYLSNRAMLNSDKEALVCEEVRLNWTELNGLSNQLGYAMKRLGGGMATG